MLKGIIIYIIIAGFIVIVGNKLGKRKEFKILEIILFLLALLFLFSGALKLSSTPTVDEDITNNIIKETGEE